MKTYNFNIFSHIHSLVVLISIDNVSDIDCLANIIPSKLKFLAYEVINTKPILLYQLSEHNEHLSSVELLRVCLFEIFFEK